MSSIDLFVGVCRVSTDAQTQGHSPADQERALRAYAAALGARDVVILHDHISGTIPIRKRPGGKELYRYIDSGRPGLAIGFDRVDRISRDKHLAELPVLLRDIDAAGLELHVVGKGAIPLGDPLQALMLILEGYAAAQANIERAKASARGRRAKATSGRVVGNGRPPYAFDREGDRRGLVYRINPDRAAHVAEVARRIIAGESSESCARWLDSIGAPTPGALWGRPARGWYNTTVVKVLRNPALIGRFRYGDLIVVDDTLRVIDVETFEAIQAALADHRRDSQRNRKGEYLLSGRLFCSCGRRMVGRPGGPGSRWYYCTSRTAGRHVQSCGEGYVRADRQRGADTLVWSEVIAWCADPERIRLGVRTRNEHQAAAVEPMRREVGELARASQREQVRLDRLVETLGRVSAAAAGSIQAKIADTARHLGELETRRADLSRQLAAPGMTIDEDAILADVATMLDGMQSATFEQRRQHLGILGVEARIVRTDGRRALRVTFDALDGVSFDVRV